MNQHEALDVARLYYGPAAYAFEERRFTGREKSGPDGWVLPEGEVYGYAVGYTRKGKRGGMLYTRKGFGSSFEDALSVAAAAMTQAQHAAYERRLRRP